MTDEPIDQPVSLPISKPTKVKIQAMVDNALKTMNERTGSSVIAIKKFIASTYSLDVEKSSNLIKKYIKESVESGRLVQAKGNSLSGSFKLSRGTLKEFEPKPKKKPSTKKAAEAKAKKEKTTEGKEPKETKAKKDAPVKKATKSASKADEQSKTATTQKKAPALKLPGAEPKLKAAAAKKQTTEGAKVTKKKPAKKQEVETEKPEAKKKTSAKKAKSPVKKKGKENIPPTKKKSQPKKKKEELMVPVMEHADSEGSLTDSPESKVKEPFSDQDEEAQVEEEFDEESDRSNGSEDDEEEEIEEEIEEEMEEEENDTGLKVTKEEDLNESDGSVSSEGSPEKVKVQPKGKAGAKPAKKRKSIATLVNSAKPKVVKR
ncbi:histone H1-III-like [Episyrphus balteatus]|uniref:histone H1-III-like n=1 Tax=Episyrphus balteatus TaxID=286459 RepID=UPI00248513D0|nr:histone H1-III-like [Episyrphus balteatus]